MTRSAREIRNKLRRVCVCYALWNKETFGAVVVGWPGYSSTDIYS